MKSENGIFARSHSLMVCCLRLLKQVLELAREKSDDMKTDSMKESLDDMLMVLMNIQCDLIRNRAISQLRLACMNSIDDGLCSVCPRNTRFSILTIQTNKETTVLLFALHRIRINYGRQAGRHRRELLNPSKLNAR